MHNCNVDGVVILHYTTHCPLREEDENTGYYTASVKNSIDHIWLYVPSTTTCSLPWNRWSTSSSSYE
jgi:hypothetical protein